MSKFSLSDIIRKREMLGYQQEAQQSQPPAPNQQLMVVDPAPASSSNGKPLAGPGATPTDLLSLFFQGKSIAGNMLQDIFQAIGGNDMPGVLQLVVGMADGIFGDMNSEDVVQALFMSRQLIDELIAKYSAQLPQVEEQEPPALDAPPVDDEEDGEEEDGEEINRMIHESAQKHGLLWNQDKYRFETQDHQPLFFDGNGPEITADGVRYRVVTEEEWAAHEAVRNQHQAS